jgi:hypothetical protein
MGRRTGIETRKEARLTVYKHAGCGGGKQLFNARHI